MTCFIIANVKTESYTPWQIQKKILFEDGTINQYTFKDLL